MNTSYIEVWKHLDSKDKRAIFQQTATQNGLPASAIEKDWWVSTVMRIVFSLNDVASHLVFKGGTSLSKGWDLIERFSEDIDLAISRDFLDFSGDLSNQQVKKLRKASCNYISNDFVEAINKKISALGIPDLTAHIQDFKDSDTDPLIVELQYRSLTQNTPYLQPRVLIEVSARSLMEPTEERAIQSMVGAQFPDRKFTDAPCFIPTVLPRRTFLEKAFLLHEEFQKPDHKTRVKRLSRHLYDLDKLSGTQHAFDALQDQELYDTIIDHRRKFNPIKGIDYANHEPDKINFIPPEEKIKEWEKDYQEMQSNMIYGNAKPFNDLIKNIKQLNERFKNMNNQ